MKYVIAENPTTGHLYPVVFDESIVHLAVAEGLTRRWPRTIKLRSAGFVRWDGARWNFDADEKSESLGGMGPQPNDELVLNLFLRDGVSGLDLANIVAFVEIQMRKGLSLNAATADAIAALREAK
jgi:hypothetical protein